MGNEDNSRGLRCDPLNEEQLEQFEAAAQEVEDELTRLTALTLPNTGLRTGEFCHLRSGWLDDGTSDE